jgi:hypothetical protein
LFAAALRLCLDSVLPRIVALCEAGSSSSSSSSSGADPQQLCAAAETLHALVVYMVGTASAVASTRDKSALFSSVYERVFPAVIRLAVTDFACAGLFERLLFQCVRWFSGPGQVGSRDVQALLDALFDRLGRQAAEGAERELCAKAVKEFFLWSVKQTTQHALAKHPGTLQWVL